KKLTLFRMEKGREKWGDRPFVTSTSHHTEGFYKKLGFETVEHTPDGFGPGIDTCKMRLALPE
ncbi:MAG: GNAT family N-acetyltransferase, partial [Blastocatellia bacterium]|nr:GNAT family N-acetyltransferase [Blastocatellia bacterium]